MTAYIRPCGLPGWVGPPASGEGETARHQMSPKHMHLSQVKSSQVTMLDVVGLARSLKKALRKAPEPVGTQPRKAARQSTLHQSPSASTKGESSASDSTKEVLTRSAASKQKAASLPSSPGPPVSKPGPSPSSQSSPTMCTTRSSASYRLTLATRLHLEVRLAERGRGATPTTREFR